MKRLIVIATVAGAIVAVPATANSSPTAHQAKSVKFSAAKCKSVGTKTGFKLGPCAVSGTFGKGKASGSLVISTVGTVNLVFKLRGGQIRLTSTGKAKGGKITGSWKFVSGNGKYRKIRGKGTFVQTTNKDGTGTIVYKGSSNK